MANEVLVKMGTPICWADATDYSATNSGIARTHQIDLTSLADGAARQGVKADFGEKRSAAYAVRVCFEPTSAPTAGNKMEVYLSTSYSGTAGTGNDGDGVTGADAAWAPQGGAEADIDEVKRHLLFVGVFPLSADADPQAGIINPAFAMPTRYGSLIVKNDSGVAMINDAVEMFVAFIPITDEVQ